jgi:hypothetical protein
MALVKCSECGKQISSSAEKCPNCGCLTAQGQENERRAIIDAEDRKRKRLFTIATIVSMILSLVALYQFVTLDQYEIWVLKTYGRVTDNMRKVFLWLAISIGVDIGSFIGNMIAKKRIEKMYYVHSQWTPMNLNLSTWTCPSCSKSNSNEKDMCSCGYSRY